MLSVTKHTNETRNSSKSAKDKLRKLVIKTFNGSIEGGNLSGISFNQRFIKRLYYPNS